MTAIPPNDAVVSNRGAARWTRGHPWIFRTDLTQRPAVPAGTVRVRDVRGRLLGTALWSPASEIALRLIDPHPEAVLDEEWWTTRLAAAAARRIPLHPITTAYRCVHGEGDALPSLVVDRYDRWLVVQLLSAGLETHRAAIVAALRTVFPDVLGILARHDVAVRGREQLPEGVELLWGEVPHEIEIIEHGIRYLAAPWDGQKTGAFLDQRANRAMIGTYARGRALDCFSYHGSFALHLAGHASSVLALDISAPALLRGAANAARNGFTNVQTLVADAFDELKRRERAGERFETIVVDPPAFAKSRGALGDAVRGYKEINLRAMRLLAPGGMLFSASCSFHLRTPEFLAMLESAAQDSGRRLAIRAVTGQPLDHPELLTIPETGYLKGALLEALD